MSRNGEGSVGGTVAFTAATADEVGFVVVGTATAVVVVADTADFNGVVAFAATGLLL
jgi:hypothetical protein